MLHGRMGLGVAAAALAGLLSAGCCQEQDKKIQILVRDKQEVLDQNKDLRTQLAAANDREAQLVRAMEDKDRMLADKDADIAGYKRVMNDPNYIRDGNTAAGWQKGAFGDMVTVGGDLLFASGKAVLTSAGKARLDKIVQDIKSSYPGKVVRVYGHTDKDPIRKSPWKDNLELSANRAMAVVRYLSKSISAKLIETVAMGEHHPVPGSKAKSRRVEIFVVKSK